MFDAVLGAVGSGVRSVAYFVGLVVLIGAVSHGLGWLLLRKRTARWVWNYWNLLGSLLVLAGAGAIAYGWLIVGFQTPAGTVVVTFGLLLASAGLWMIVPV